MTTPSGPLRGIRVVEMAGLGPAPFCGMLLADMGAEVIRVDRIGDADLGLKRDPRFDIVSRGKRSVAIDVKSAAGRAAVLRLVAGADVLIEGFRPGMMERLGLGPDPCLEVNPRLVFGRITGWGQDGPLAQAAGHDLNYIALVGALDAIGDAADRPPVAPLNLVGDFGGGSMYLAFGIASALVERATSGHGQVIDAAIVDGVTHLLAGVHGQVSGGTWQQQRGEHVLGGAAPWNTVYATSDGRYVSVCAIEQRFWAELLKRLEIDPATLPDRMDRAHWPALRERFAVVFSGRTQAAWRARLEGSDACFAPVLGVAEVQQHPHVQARGLLQTVAGIPQPAVAPRLDRTPGAIQGECIARPGQHTDAVLRDWGFAADEIADLHAAGAAA